MPILTPQDITVDNYCMSFLTGSSTPFCDHWSTYIPASSLGVAKENFVSGIMYGGSMILILLVVLFFLKKLFNFLFKA